LDIKYFAHKIYLVFVEISWTNLSSIFQLSLQFKFGFKS